MRYRKLTPAGDYTLGSGGDWHVNTPEGVAQAVRTRLALWAGEWFADTEDGTPWATDVLGKYTSLTRDAVIKERILGTPGVRALSAYTSTFDSQARRLTIAATIVTDYGAAALETTL